MKVKTIRHARLRGLIECVCNFVKIYFSRRRSVLSCGCRSPPRSASGYILPVFMDPLAALLNERPPQQLSTTELRARIALHEDAARAYRAELQRRVTGFWTIYDDLATSDALSAVASGVGPAPSSLFSAPIVLRADGHALDESIAAGSHGFSICAHSAPPLRRASPGSRPAARCVRSDFRRRFGPPSDHMQTRPHRPLPLLSVRRGETAISNKCHRNRTPVQGTHTLLPPLPLDRSCRLLGSSNLRKCQSRSCHLRHWPLHCSCRHLHLYILLRLECKFHRLASHWGQSCRTLDLCSLLLRGRTLRWHWRRCSRCR